MTENATYPIVLSGWYGQYNAGDDAILDVFVEQVRKRTDATITVLSECPHQVEPRAGLHSAGHPLSVGHGTLRNMLNGTYLKHLRTLRASKLVVLGGGGLLRDNTNWRNLIRLLDELWLAKLFGRRAMLYAIGVGPFRSALGKRVIGMTVRMCDLVTVRSERCAELLRSVGVPDEKIHVVADPAFLLEPQTPHDPELHAMFAGGNKIGFYPTFALLLHENVDAELAHLAAALDALVERHGAEIVAVPMSVLADGFDDVKVARMVQALMKHPDAMQIYTRRLNAPELKWVTGQARLNVTVRLHAMIFSLGCGTPVVAANYEPKVANVGAGFGVQRYIVDMDAELGTRLADAGSAALNDLPAYRAELQLRRDAVTAAAAETFELMDELFFKPCTRTQRLPA